MSLPALVVLAAGASARLGEPKALVLLGGRSALEHLLEAGRALGREPPLVVTGAHHEPIARHVEQRGLRCELLPNPRWAEGRVSGLRLARAARAGRDLAVAPVDAPLVGRRTFDALAERWLAAGAPPRGWLAPRFEPTVPGAEEAESAGRHGHPLFLGRELAEELGGLHPGESLRALRARAEPLLSLAVPWPEVLDDLDRPEDLARLRARFGA